MEAFSSKGVVMKRHIAAGWAYTPYFLEYLDGVQNELALRHVPYVAPRQDWLAGPYGRRADKVPASLQCGTLRTIT